MALTANTIDHPLRGELPGATNVGTSGEPGEGPYVRLWLKVEAETIKAASYRTPGCPSSIAAASMTVRLITGRTVEQAMRLEAKDLLLILGGLPEGRGHIATMCIEALRDGLRRI
jgi:NifU-like protein involved in Fe-S cluster formation